MKNPIKSMMAVAVMALICLLPLATKAQVVTKCPYIIKNNRGCDITFQYEVRTPVSSGPCPTICSGPVTLPPGGTFVVPCCPPPPFYNVIVVLTNVGGSPISGSNVVEGSGTCVPYIPSASGPVPNGCTPAGSYTMIWTTTMTMIN